MNTSHALIIALFLVALATTTAGRVVKRRSRSAPRRCTGTAKYRVTFNNFLSGTSKFRTITDFPADGLAFSPMVAVSHDPRISLFTIRGFASPAVEEVCETGNNAMLLTESRALGDRVTSVVGADSGTPGGRSVTLEVTATCENSYLTAISMIAPSPDWIVQINNMPLLQNGRFISGRSGRLFAYDCGTDSGRDFTAPNDPSLDQPTVPADNIVLLSMDETDRFSGRQVGSYKVQRIM